jgi:hypothetical protein
MVRRALLVSVVLMLAALPAFAQPGKVEVTGTVGWTFADGVSFTATPIATPVTGTYNRADPKDSVSFGLGIGVFASETGEIEFMWNHQPTKLEVTGTGPVISGNMGIDNYHANFVFNAGPHDQMVRPFFYIGLGATNFHDAQFPNRTVSGDTRFSWVAGAGVKAYATPHAGFRAAVRWVPTYIKTDQAGWWCDPYWGCAPAGNPQYANQLELSGGVVFKFVP